MTKITTFFTCAVSALAIASAARAADPEMIVFDWAGWEIDAMLSDYVAKHGMKPTYSFFGDDDEAFQKVNSGFKADVVHPCSPSVQRYRDAGLIEPWDIARIPEYKNIPEYILNSSPTLKDDGGVWFMPVDYAYAAVAYNTKEVPAEDVATLQVFKDPKYAGRISLPDSTDDIWALAFLATGVSDWNKASDEQFAAAAAWLREVHPNVLAYWADPSQQAQLMATGEVLVAWSWNDGVAVLQEEGFPVGFQRSPAEGASAFYCGYVNFKDAPGSEDKTYDFINSILAPASAKGLLDELGYAHSNQTGVAMIPPEELVAAFVDPIDTTILVQAPVSPEMREKMISEFELIKAGF